MRGWNVNRDSENYQVRQRCVELCNIDIIGIAESHLISDEQLIIDGYSWFGHNRSGLHKRAKTGSGGVGFFN